VAEAREKVAGHLESIEADEIFRVVTSRPFGLAAPAPATGAVNLNVL